MPELREPGSDEYAAATAPHNSSGSQQPAFVARARSAEDVAAVIRECAGRGLTVLPQATGHGAGGNVGADTVVLDTSGLDALHIDGDVARAGAGLTWGTVNAEAERHGRLGLAGSAPSVCIAGYTFGGGIGFLARPHGMAAGALRRVEYVDGHGAMRTASDDAADAIDREAIFAFRGGGGLGVATSLEFDLVTVPDLYAGYLLWPVEHLDAVVDAWASAMAQVADDVATSISVLHTPPAPLFPEDLRGVPVVHLAVAAGNGDAGPLLDAVRAAAPSAVDTWGPADAQKLGGIHLDPPDAVPGIGDARWLTADAPALVADLLRIAAPADSPVTMLEVRSVGNDAAGPEGAESTVPGPYLWHAVGALTGPDARPPLEHAFAAAQEAVAPADVGRSVGSWMEGATSVPDALPADVRARVAAAADAVDPDRAIRRTRFLT